MSFETDAPQSAKILVGICTCQGRSALRDGIRQIWKVIGCPGNITPIFFLGSREESLESDVVNLNVEDSYDSLPKKVHAFLNYALKMFDFDYLFKCDDDTYVAPDRLADLVRFNVDLVGNSHLRWGWPSGGAGYFISRRTVEILANMPEPENGAEDVWVGKCVQAFGLKSVMTEKLQDNYYLFPRRDNDIVTAHHCPLKIMGVIQQLFTASDEIQQTRSFKAKHVDWEGSLELLSNGIFLGGFLHPHGTWELDDTTKRLVLNWFSWGAETLQAAKWGYKSETLSLIENTPESVGRYEEYLRAPDICFEKIHIGCGKHRIEGWSNFDMEMDLRKRLPIADCSIRLVFAERVVEHLTPSEAWNLFKEIRRVLRPGGGVRIIVPCVDLLSQRFDESYGEFVHSVSGLDRSLESAMESIICNWEHRAIWTIEALRSVLGALGFETWESNVGKSQFPEAAGIDGHSMQIGEHANWVESGVVEARKR